MPCSRAFFNAGVNFSSRSMAGFYHYAPGNKKPPISFDTGAVDFNPVVRQVTILS